MQTVTPGSVEETAEVLGTAAAESRIVRARGGGTKLDWGLPVSKPDVEISTSRLARLVEHNGADLTAVIEAGARLGDVQGDLAEAGQMIALDPPLGPERAATMGGVVATGDSGPLRHRYGAPRDLLLGVTVVLADGMVARAGGKVIKNVAGYDLAKLVSGSFGTLGVIATLVVRLHPAPAARVTVFGTTSDPDVLQRAAIAAAHAPLELESLDVSWERGAGRLLGRCAGAAPEPRARRATAVMARAGLEASVELDDEHLWMEQRDRQRSARGVAVRVSAVPTELARVIRAADRVGGSMVGRVVAGLSWIALPPASVDELAGTIEDLRRDLSPAPSVLLDGPRALREKVDVWGVGDGPELALMRRVKTRFDPDGILNPGVFVGGI